MYRYLVLISIYVGCILGEPTVRFAAVIYRHGDRTPVDTYPTDPWRNESLWPVKFGELTNIGKQQHYALGMWLRNRYSHLLSEEFEPSEIYVRSTDVDRTLMSAQANLAGMYPPRDKYIWNKNLLWQPIPIHTMPEKTDAVLSMKKACAVYDREMNKLEHSKPYLDNLKKYQSLMNYLTANTGKVIRNFEDIEDIYSILYIESLYNFTLPKWTNKYYPDVMQKPACYSFALSAATPLLARLKAGPLVKEIVTKMKHMTIKKPGNTQKVIIYSGHDFTIGTVLTGLGLFDGNCPSYTSTILMELLSDNLTSVNYIRISYRNTPEIVEPAILNIPYCGELCPLERFVKLYENLLTVNFDEECRYQVSGVFALCMFGGLLIFISIYALHKIYFFLVYKRSRGNLANNLNIQDNAKENLFQRSLPGNAKVNV